MSKCAYSAGAAAIACLMAGASTMTIAQAQSLNIADNDSVYVDAKAFQITLGKAKGEAAAQIKALGARALGPGAIIIRSGDKFYIADGVPLDQTASAAGPQYVILVEQPLRPELCQRGGRPQRGDPVEQRVWPELRQRGGGPQCGDPVEQRVRPELRQRGGRPQRGDPIEQCVWPELRQRAVRPQRDGGDHSVEQRVWPELCQRGGGPQ